MPINQSKQHKFQILSHQEALQRYLKQMDDARQQAMQLHQDAISYINECNGHLSESLNKKNALLQQLGDRQRDSRFQIFERLGSMFFKSDLEELNKAISHWENEIKLTQKFLSEQKPSKFAMEAEATYQEMVETYQELNNTAKQYL